MQTNQGFLAWMPNKTFVSCNEKDVPGRKEDNDDVIATAPQVTDQDAVNAFELGLQWAEENGDQENERLYTSTDENQSSPSQTSNILTQKSPSSNRRIFDNQDKSNSYHSLNNISDIAPETESQINRGTYSIKDNFVKKENIYLFPTLHHDTPITGYKVMQKHAKLSGAKSQAITSTRLRKHLATMSQILELSPNDIEQLATFMGTPKMFISRQGSIRKDFRWIDLDLEEDVNEESSDEEDRKQEKKY
ncbi:hypothetical protein JTB14_030704 [Gonioctena quinquepunctata]|nr:hypothetical protein JTB14_030704 [Gonioctena quinquepunctata]